VIDAVEAVFHAGFKGLHFCAEHFFHVSNSVVDVADAAVVY
jgi:hypothetical protein